ncbi:MAG: diguanylate cyclase [Pseudomonadota bacterium]|nr:diguanylate cyclase [Pseudomonadota bacterium]
MLSAEDLLHAKILVVDDSADNVDLLLAMLEQEGYSNLSSTTSPLEVVELHRQHQYDLILLDIQMPVMDGFKVMDGLRELEQDAWLPVLAITAQPGYKNRALEAGAKDFISKPFDFVEVTQRIRNMLEVRLLYNRATRTSETLHRLALHDPLTGLPNRRLLEDRIGTAIEHARRNRSHVAMMYIDLDGFKEVNDTWGHDCGDILLQMVSDRLVCAARGEDTVARIGGDEFMVVLGELNDPEDIHIPAKKLVAAVAEPYQIKGQTVIVTTSIGISIYPYDAATVEALITSSDRALYQAKRAGKNRYHISVADRIGPPHANGALSKTL